MLGKDKWYEYTARRKLSMLRIMPYTFIGTGLITCYFNQQ